jgi:SagB-type dehydrogenase family enzyme
MGLSGLAYLTREAAAMLSLIGKEEKRGGAFVALPKPAPLGMGLGEVISRRRSVRKFSGEAVPFESLAALIKAASGITATSPRSNENSGFALRSTPSGGGLYPVDLYIAAMRVIGLQRAVYFYDPHRDGLWLTADHTATDALLAALALPHQVIEQDRACAVFLLVSRPWRSMRKYGNRGLRHVFIEAGAMAEHVSLAAVALNLGSVHCASFYDDEAHEAIGIDGLHETLVHSIFLGVRSGGTSE